MGRAHCGGKRHPRSRLGQATQAAEANVNIFDQVTEDDQQKTMLAALKVLKDA
jgi:hypothetical protein